MSVIVGNSKAVQKKNLKEPKKTAPKKSEKAE